MINPYEIVSKSALPALRAMVAKRLHDEYHLTQEQVATRLGVTQASVSNYNRKTRGVMLNLETDSTVVKAADKMAAALSSSEPDQAEALRLMTQTCDYIRLNHLMCSLHGDLEPGFRVDGCDACSGNFTAKDFDRLKIAISN